MVTRFTLPHIDISNRAVNRPYQAPRESWPGASVRRSREEHGQRLQTELAAAFAEADEARPTDNRLLPATGVYLEIELRPGDKADELEKKQAGMRPGAVRIEDDLSTTVALFVPDGARPVLEQILNDYTSGPLTAKKQEPQRKAFVEPIESIRQARLETLWTDDLDELPSEPQQSIWWEVWCFKSMALQVLDAVQRLGARAADQESHLYFPEAIVIPVFASRVTIELMLFATVGISELRRASASPYIFLEEGRQAQLDRATALAERVTWPGADVPAVCLLDTGVNRSHVLIEPALAAKDLAAVRAEWGTADAAEGHGTQMAGLALHGDLTPLMLDEREVVLTHRVESVKVLPPGGFPPNNPKSYGSITQSATALAESAAPERSRVFCLAVTNQDVSGSRPSTWSAAIDQAAVGEMPGDEDAAPRRLFFVSAGNAPAEVQRARILSADDYPIEDPAQAWNAITVGGYTDKVVIDGDDLAGWTAFAEAGDVSPFTRTSVTWPQSRSPYKPDIVMESGNRAVSPSGVDVLTIDSLSLLTTGADVARQTLVPFSATSAATALAARMAAKLAAEFPGMWPETIRALMIHSAEWTEAMRAALGPANKKTRYALLRRFGYGVPSLERAIRSARNHLALVAQNTITPFKVSDGRKFKDCHFYRLPWPREVLEDLGSQDVRLKITLSYFVEPNPGSLSANDPQRYQSHGLRFDLKRRLETDTQFLQRVSPLEREDPHERVRGIPADEGWDFGSQSVSAGSLHCDEWRGPATHLVERDLICVKPVIGWWRTRGTTADCNRETRYALVMTLVTPDVNIHNAISTLVENEVDVEISFDARSQNGA